MDSRRFDAIVRAFVVSRGPRRTLFAGFVGGALVVAGADLRDGSAAGKRKQRLKRNRYGCVPVGKACRGKDNVCCSGICRGEKPKKGDKDTSRCVAHDAGGCAAGQHPGICGGEDVECTTTNLEAGRCGTTTGNAGYCYRAISLDPAPCRRDADCQEGRAGAACIRCPSSAGTRCVAF